ITSQCKGFRGLGSDYCYDAAKGQYGRQTFHDHHLHESFVPRKTIPLQARRIIFRRLPPWQVVRVVISKSVERKRTYREANPLPRLTHSKMNNLRAIHYGLKVQVPSGHHKSCLLSIIYALLNYPLRGQSVTKLTSCSKRAPNTMSPIDPF